MIKFVIICFTLYTLIQVSWEKISFGSQKLYLSKGNFWPKPKPRLHRFGIKFRALTQLNASIFIKIGEKLQKNIKSQKIKVGGNWEELWQIFIFSCNWQSQVKYLEKIFKKKH